jgi:hypothetical protein
MDPAQMRAAMIAYLEGALEFAEEIKDGVTAKSSFYSSTTTILPNPRARSTRPIRTETRAKLIASIAKGRQWLEGRAHGLQQMGGIQDDHAKKQAPGGLTVREQLLVYRPGDVGEDARPIHNGPLAQSSTPHHRSPQTIAPKIYRTPSSNAILAGE